MACLCSYIDSTWLHLVQFWWNDKRIIVITGEKKIFSFIAWMKWNEINFCLQWMILSTQTSSIPFITCSLCWKIKYSISLYIWAPFKTSQNVYFDIPFPLLSQGFWILYTTLLFLQFFFSSKIEGDSLCWNATIYWKFYAQFLCYYLCSKKRQYNVDICSGFTMNIYEIVSAPMITNYIVSGIIFTNYETGRNDFKTIR